MQAACLLRKLCFATAVGVSLAAPAAAHAGDLRISVSRVETEKTLRGRGVAVDGRTFVTDGIHYRLYGEPPLAAGSPEEARARSNLQRRLDAGPMRVRTMETEPTGFRLVTLERNG